jgi:predicted CoA-substrate-specific enzyme activase
LFDAVCENVQVLIKPRVSPKRVVLTGGVSRSRRIRANFGKFLKRNEMELLSAKDEDSLYFEALGCACIAARRQEAMPAMGELFVTAKDIELDRLPPASEFLTNVRRLKAKPPSEKSKKSGPMIVGYDIGSTGSKIVALDFETSEPVWQGYVNTNGAPVRAAQELTQQFVDSPVADRSVVAIGATGSGREIVGSLMSTCFGTDGVFVLNEIAAHAEGALHYDSSVDTIFEIGGQDAKYIRLSEGRVIDAAMNEACSAGTGSFIEEQGRKFKGIDDVVQLGKEACGADFGVSLGQHCSVFMAEIIDEAVAAEVPRNAIVAGIYDSIIQNYLNRVKGSRSVGKVVFCQGMPFAADALAAAVARQTGSDVVIPPDPGTVGALGIALLAKKECNLDAGEPLQMRRFLAADVVKKDVFICRSKKGCGGGGNKCRIDRITTVVDGQKQKFMWGGGCSMYDKGTGKRKLPDRTPDPFREREALVEAIRQDLSDTKGSARVAITDEFVLKSYFPFFSTFIHDLGFDLTFHSGADQAMLKRGIEDANVPFCAPMQQYHGIVSTMIEDDPDYLFMPMIRNIPRVGDERTSVLCPIVQGSPEMMRHDLRLSSKTKILSPVINFGEDNFNSELFRNSCSELAQDLGVGSQDWEQAFTRALKVQEKFESDCFDLGRAALEFCEKKKITTVVVLGRAYTIYNTVLNSNIPAILREQGTVPIPMDCYPVDDDVPVFYNMFWGYGQRNLRVAHQIRRTPGVYSLYCSNYSCGPDSFNIHFYSYIMAGKPFAIIETDGHSGDAGTKTRVEAFLYCVNEDLRQAGRISEVANFKRFEADFDTLDEIRRKDATVLVPRMGAGAAALAACLRGHGVKAEALPLPTRDTLALGRRYTSGKECIPVTLTLGSLLARMEESKDTDQVFSFFMPTASGPCRFGAYNVLQKIVIERLGLQRRVGFWSPIDDDYFEGMDDGFSALVFCGFMASDLLLAGLYDTRPVEREKGAAEEVFEYYHQEILKQLEKAGKGDLSAGAALSQVLSGHLFGIKPLLERAAKAFKKVKTERQIPTVLVVGELYVRCDPFANGFVIRKLEERGIRGRFAAFNEWLEYTDYQDVQKTKIPEYASSFLQATIQNVTYRTMAEVLGWPPRTTVQDQLVAGGQYIREQLSGEAILTIGGPIHEWAEGHIDGAVSVGPLECMPNKIAEAQFFHIAEEQGVLTLTLPLNGDPIDGEVLDNFAYEVHAQFNRRRTGQSIIPPPPIARRPSWVPQSKVNPRD